MTDPNTIVMYGCPPDVPPAAPRVFPDPVPPYEPPLLIPFDVPRRVAELEAKLALAEGRLALLEEPRKASPKRRVVRLTLSTLRKGCKVSAVDLRPAGLNAEQTAAFERSALRFFEAYAKALGAKVRVTMIFPDRQVRVVPPQTGR